MLGQHPGPGQPFPPPPFGFPGISLFNHPLHFRKTTNKLVLQVACPHHPSECLDPVASLVRPLLSISQSQLTLHSSWSQWSRYAVSSVSSRPFSRWYAPNDARWNALSPSWRSASRFQISTTWISATTDGRAESDRTGWIWASTWVWWGWAIKGMEGGI